MHILPIKQFDEQGRLIDIHFFNCKSVTDKQAIRNLVSYHFRTSNNIDSLYEELEKDGIIPIDAMRLPIYL